MNPGVKELTQIKPDAPRDQIHQINSLNHSGDGQNILYGDGHVEFNTTPYAGVQRDNIYTYGTSGGGAGDGIVGSPVGPNDSILLPTASAR